ncbi:hypothetical protein [Gloeobacter violaceus]|nr:hypothetical protein [Gloeobacter violaceus]
MDPAVLATLSREVTVFLSPFLPHLLALTKDAAKQAAEAAGKALGADAWSQAKTLWSRLWPKMEAKAVAVEAAQDVLAAPNDQDAQAALRQQIKKLLNENPELADEIARLWGQGQRRRTVTANGERSVAIGGNVSGSNIVTGNNNTVGSHQNHDQAGARLEIVDGLPLVHTQVDEDLVAALRKLREG